MSQRTRVVFAVHRVPADDDVLLAIPALSGSRQLQIQSVLIRDANLVRAAALAATREVLPGGVVRNLSPQKIDQHFTAMASRLRERVEALAARFGYPATFREMEGQDYSALEPLAHEADFVAITRPDAIGATPTGTDADTPVPCRTTTLFINEPWLSGSSVLVAYEGRHSEKALEIAERYARQAELPLVLITPDGLPSASIDPSYTVHRATTPWSDTTIATLCHQHNARLLVLGGRSQSDWQAVARLLLESVPCSILQVVAQPDKASNYAQSTVTG